MNYLDIRNAISANPELSALLPDSHAITAAMTNVVEYHVGRGDVLRVLGLVAGSAFLDVIQSSAEYRHAWPLLAAGQLNIGDPQVRAAIDGFVQAAILTTEQGAALKSLAETKHDELEVRKAIWNPDGTRAI